MEKEKYNLDTFQEKGFLTINELKEIANSSKSKTALEILSNKGANSLYRVIWSKKNKEYNTNYFRNTYSSKVNRIPYWELEDINVESIERISQEQSDLISCLFEAGLISQLTYAKLKQKNKQGTFYRLWEILNVASTLTQNEEYYSNISLKSDLQSLEKSGLIKNIDLDKIEYDLINKSINQNIELFEKYDIGYTFRFINNSTSKPSEVEQRIRTVLDFFLPKLPYYKNHSINTINFFSDIPHPTYKNGKQKSCVVDLTFNDSTISFPTKDYGYLENTNPSVYLQLTPKIIFYLNKKYEKEYSPIIVANTHFDSSNIREDIESFTLLILKNNPTFKINRNWFKTIQNNDHPHLSKEEKLTELNKFFDIFDSSRFKSYDKEKIISDVLNSEILSLETISSYIQNFIAIVWNDSLVSGLGYKTAIKDLIKISNNNYNNAYVTETKKGDKTLLEIKFNNKEYSIEINNNKFDFNFCKIFLQMQEEHSIKGSFYTHYNSAVEEDGQSYVFLTQNEYEKIKEMKLIHSMRLI